MERIRNDRFAIYDKATGHIKRICNVPPDMATAQINDDSEALLVCENQERHETHYIDLTGETPVFAERVELDLPVQPIEIVADGVDRAEYDLPDDMIVNVGGQPQSAVGNFGITSPDVKAIILQPMAKYKGEPGVVHCLAPAAMTAKIRRQIKEAYLQKLGEGLMYADHKWDIDADSANRISSAAANYARLGEVPQGFFWVDANDNEVELTYTQLLELAAAVEARVFELFKRKRRLNQAVDAKPTAREQKTVLITMDKTA